MADRRIALLAQIQDPVEFAPEPAPAADAEVQTDASFLNTIMPGNSGEASPPATDLSAPSAADTPSPYANGDDPAADAPPADDADTEPADPSQPPAASE